MALYLLKKKKNAVLIVSYYNKLNNFYYKYALSNGTKIVLS